jgi:outer membrane protein
MTRLKLFLLTTIITTVAAAPAVLRAQSSKVAAVDFERAVVQNAEGKKASEKFNAAVQAKQTQLAQRQKDIDDATKKLQNGARTLSDAAKAELQRDIDKKTTELQRLNEDAQKELEMMRDELLRPIAQRATALLNAMAEQQGYTLVVDVSNPQSNVVFVNEKFNITEDLIKRIDAEAAKAPAASEAPKPAGTAPGANATRPPSTGPATAPKPPATATPQRPTTTTAPKP